MISRISLATDFSPEGVPAFHAALALAVAHKARLDILHVGRHGGQPAWENFPRVRETLAAWGLLPAGAPQEDVMTRLGVAIAKVEIHGHDPAAGIAEFMSKHRPDLLVAASHGHSDGSWWNESSVAMEATRRADLPSLLFGPQSRDMVAPATGALRLRTALMPVAEVPAPRPAVMKLEVLFEPDGIDVHFVHAAQSAQAMAAIRAELPDALQIEGEVVPAILQAAERLQADVIAMPTARHKGLLGALRGSTTQKVLREARCAVLALPS